MPNIELMPLRHSIAVLNNNRPVQQTHNMAVSSRNLIYTTARHVCILPASTLAPLQRAQNAAARLALGLDRRSHITTALQKLHWLPVKYRVTFKIATIMHQTFHRRCPSYLSDLVVFASADSNVRQLRFSTTRVAAVKRSRTQFGRRAFSVAGPTYGTVSRHHPYHRLPPSLPSCAQDTSVLLSI